MFSAKFITIVVLSYLVLLFLVAYYGDRSSRHSSRQFRNIVYGLSLAVYCSSWTFLGAAGSAARAGWDYFAIFLGPILLFTVGLKVVRKIVVISKQQSTSTVSDFISTRYGSNRPIAVIITIIAVIGSLPYIGLQLKAVTMAFGILTTEPENVAAFTTQTTNSFLFDPAFYIALILIWFAILFGTRNYDATEHHRGVMSAIAFESIIKLLAILIICYYASTLFSRTTGNSLSIPRDLNFLSYGSNQFEIIDFLVKTLLSLFAAILLPRQFHVGINEAENDIQVSQSAKYFVFYLIIFSLVIPPITLAGITVLPNSNNSDLFVLSLPLLEGNKTLSILAYLGAVSAATGMVIVSSIAISTMVCNDIALPWLLRLQKFAPELGDIPQLIIFVRRISIAAIILLSYGYYSLTDGTKALANIGLISFAATAQFAPSMIASLYWRGSNAFGVKLGLILGFIVWAYTLLIPTLFAGPEAASTLTNIGAFNPEALFGYAFPSTLAHGVFWSLLVNVLGLFFGSVFTQNKRIESLQAQNFVDTELSSYIPSKPPKIHSTYFTGQLFCEKIIGNRQTSKLFSALRANSPFNDNDQIHPNHLSEIERSLAAVVGNPTAKQLVRQALYDTPESTDYSNIIEQTSRASRFSYSILQSTLENIGDAISVIDNNQNLIAWNSRYVNMFNYPDSLMRIGTPALELLKFNVERGHLRNLESDTEIKTRFQHFIRGTAFSVERELEDGRFIRIYGNPIPNGGFVTSYTDITGLKTVEKQLEIRVNQRTRELEKITESLKTVTEDKTRFLAAASHDLLQPINAARLFAYSLKNNNVSTDEHEKTIDKIDQALVSADNILRTLLNITQLDKGSITPSFTPVKINDLLTEVVNETLPSATKKGIELSYLPTKVNAKTDYQLFFSVMQNIISNAVRYTSEGTVNVSVKRKLNKVLIEVKDTGVGISEPDQQKIFDEFSKGSNSDSNGNINRGVGLGLSIVKRICGLLNHKLTLNSILDQGTTVTVELPLSSRPTDESNEKIDVGKNTDKNLSELAKLNILCLDNDIDALQGLKSILSNWGCNALVASTIDEATEILAEDPINIVLADYQLDHGEFGLNLLLGLKDRSISSINQPALMLITATQDDQLFEKCDRLNIDYLNKPINPESLKNWLLLFKTTKKKN